MTQRTEQELRRYLGSREFAEKCAALNARALDAAEVGKIITFEEEADALDLPLDFVRFNFARKLERASGDVRQ